MESSANWIQLDFVNDLNILNKNVDSVKINTVCLIMMQRQVNEEYTKIMKMIKS